MHGQVPFWKFFRKTNMALFNPCMKIKIILNSTFIFKDFGFGSHKLKIEFTKHPKES